MCQFAITQARCLDCRSLADCLDEKQPVPAQQRPPRTDGPLKVIVPWNRTRRRREAFV